MSRRRDRFKDQVNNTEQRWCYADGLTDYLMEAVNGFITLPEAPFVGSFAGDTEAIDWALLWLPEGGELLTESYVNLIPTMQGGTHVNGLRQGLLDAMRDFCEYRNILPRGVKLSADDIWERCAYVLSVKCRIHSSRVRRKSGSPHVNVRPLSPVLSKMPSAYG